MLFMLFTSFPPLPALVHYQYTDFHYFQGTAPLWRKKLTECTSKMTSLCNNMTNVYAKCRTYNKKIEIFFSYFLCYSAFNLWYMSWDFHSLKLQMRPEMTSIYTFSFLVAEHTTLFFCRINSPFCSRTYLYSYVERQPPKSNQSRYVYLISQGSSLFHLCDIPC